MSRTKSGHTKEEEIEMMKSPDRWPLWPYLPLRNRKRNGLPPEGLGLLVERGINEGPNKVRPRVYLTNLFRGIQSDTVAIDYTDFEAICDAGWEVD